MSVQFGFRTGPLGCSAEQAAAALAELGYDCLELCLESADVRPETMTEARAQELVRMLADVGAHHGASRGIRFPDWTSQNPGSGSFQESRTCVPAH